MKHPSPDILWEYASNQLPSLKADEIALHLSDCARCSNAVETARCALDTLSVHHRDEEFTARVMSRLPEESRSEERSFSAFFAEWMFPCFSYACAAALLFVWQAQNESVTTASVLKSGYSNSSELFSDTLSPTLLLDVQWSDL